VTKQNREKGKNRRTEGESGESRQRKREGGKPRKGEDKEDWRSRSRREKQDLLRVQA